MPEDFLKKIESNKNSNQNNPFEKLFESKKSEIKPATEAKSSKSEDKPDSMEGIENLGKSPTSKERYRKTESFDEKKPADSGDDELGIEREPKGLEVKIAMPARKIEDENILSSSNRDLPQNSFLSGVSSSTSDLSFEDESSHDDHEKRISEVSKLLRNNKKSEAIDFINKNF